MGLSDLPDASGTQHQKAFESLGWSTRRHAEHIVMTHPDIFGVTLAIPNHRIVKRTTAQAGASRRFDRRNLPAHFRFSLTDHAPGLADRFIAVWYAEPK